MNIETIECESSVTGLAYTYIYRKAEYTVILSKENDSKGYSLNVWRSKGRSTTVTVYFWSEKHGWKTETGRTMGKYLKGIVEFIEADTNAAVA